VFYAWIDGEYRQPRQRGESTSCPSCNSVIHAVFRDGVPPYWRHRKGDCDAWSEPEGEWHLGWKRLFPADCREITLRSDGEMHRADVMIRAGTPLAHTLELQHSPISRQDIAIRERFYSRMGGMTWVVHLHDDQGALNDSRFSASLTLLPKQMEFKGRNFVTALWCGRVPTFIEKWKHSNAHVFFDWRGRLFYLATMRACRELVAKLEKGKFAVLPASTMDLMRTIGWSPERNEANDQTAPEPSAL